MRSPYLIAALGIALAAGLGLYLFSLTPQLGLSQEERAAQQQAEAKRVAEERQRALDLTLAKGTQRSLANYAAFSQHVLDQAETERRLWKERVLALSSNDEGRLIAADMNLTKEYWKFHLAAEKTDGPDAIAALRERLAPLRTELDRTVADPAATLPPSAAVHAQLDDIAKQAQESVIHWRLGRDQVESVLRIAIATGLPPAETTLRATIERIHDQELADVRNCQEVAEEEDRK